MAREAVSTCPICDHDLTITRLHCAECGTTLEGSFAPGRFARLSREQLALLESFLRSRGNLREMERELGISYPTVRNRVESLVRTLGLADGTTAEVPAAPPQTDLGARRRAILERLARRELSANDAAAELRALVEKDR